jgi:AhpD family alkylhydroperoxidase
MRLLYAFSFALAVIGAGAVSYDANAQDAPSADKAYSEMKEMFGGIPSVMRIYPKSAVPAGWALIKETDLNKNTALPAKTRELIGLAVAAQIPCNYCIYYHTVAAKAAGASEEEIKEAVHMSSLVRHWSMLLYGNQFDLPAYVAETDAAFKSQ